MSLEILTNLVLSSLTVVGQIIILGLVYLILSKKQIKGFNGIFLALVVALVATGGSLFYSEIIGYIPCKLCWFQRIFMYPQVILLGVAYWKKEKTIIQYSMTMSLIGGLISIYHYLIQTQAAPSFACTINGASDCAAKVTLQFGYITIPLMALTAFVMIILLLQIEKNIK